ncbi:uncharacterized protein TM35_000063950 [Trypanosoma theileri]|uniref:Uncharacterized protein n=1 Tax=Trypanosoma theileri TaxID=67003 RepID=A0A1X0P4L9_9TRYP|nr:uncharacterized protein TM35_000063950 [Trypanosoma theileri]ORC91390.1 hypothetical protein TM35_000063950 [Trypanosoma theileri]
MSGYTVTPHSSPPLLLPSTTAIATTTTITTITTITSAATPPLLGSATAVSTLSSSSSSSTSSSLRVGSQRSKEIVSPQSIQITQDGSWHCICGTISTTSSSFFKHSRNCSVRKGISSSLSLEKKKTVEDPPTVREQMFFSLQEAVASGKLLGDSLAAAVNAIQSATEEKKEDTHIRGSWRLTKTFLPVSGSALISAATRIAYTTPSSNSNNTIVDSNDVGKMQNNVEMNSVSVNEKEGTTDDNDDRSCSSPYYTVLPQGLPVSKRIQITRTYRHRAAFVVSEKNMNSSPPQSKEHVEENNNNNIDNNTLLSSSPPQQQDASSFPSVSSSPLSVPQEFPVLQFNTTHSDMSYYVYKRFLSRDDLKLESNEDDNSNNNDDDESRAKKSKMDFPCMDKVLRQERRRIARVPMPVIEWNYPK